MTRRKAHVLRPFTDFEHQQLLSLARSQRASVVNVRRARMLLAVHDGQSYQDACRANGYADGDPARRLVGRFNQEGLAALTPRHAGGPRVQYGPRVRQAILDLVAREPSLELHGTKTWSLTSLRCTLREAGYPSISTYTIWTTLTGHSLSWQRTRSWCHTGISKRWHTYRLVTKKDPEAAAKKV